MPFPILAVVALAAVAASAYGTYSANQNANEMGQRASDEQSRNAEDNARISHYDAGVALAQAKTTQQTTMIDLKLQYQNINRFLGTARAGFASRGVKVGTGSPLNVQIESLKAGLEDASRILYNGNTAAQEARSLADRYNLLADVGLRDAAAQGTLIRQAAGVTASNAAWQGISQTLSTAYNFGSAMTAANTAAASTPYIPAL